MSMEEVSVGMGEAANPVHDDMGNVVTQPQTAPEVGDTIPNNPDPWRGGLCTILCQYPMCLFAMMCPQAILAQLHWKLNEDRPSYALFGYYFILVFITGCMVFVGTFPNAAIGVGQVNFLFMTIVLLSLYKKARDLGNIRGNYYASLCGKSCCPDACADTFDVFGFPCLALARLGHHVFNYNHNESPNGAITYEPIDVEFELVRECDPVREAANNTGIEKV